MTFLEKNFIVGGLHEITFYLGGRGLKKALHPREMLYVIYTQFTACLSFI